MNSRAAVIALSFRDVEDRFGVQHRCQTAKNMLYFGTGDDVDLLIRVVRKNRETASCTGMSQGQAPSYYYYIQCCSKSQENDCVKWMAR